jgi:hypothetical protein
MILKVLGLNCIDAMIEKPEHIDEFKTLMRAVLAANK